MSDREPGTVEQVADGYAGECPVCRTTWEETHRYGAVKLIAACCEDTEKCYRCNRVTVDSVEVDLLTGPSHACIACWHDRERHFGRAER